VHVQTNSAISIPPLTTGARGAGWSVALVALASFWLLAGPRLELITIASSSVRFEDLILVALAVYCIAGWSSGARKRHVKRGALVVALIGLACAVIGFAMGRTDLISGVLYALRPLEYWVVFPALVIALGRDFPAGVAVMIRVLAAVSVVQVGVALLQIAGLTIGFSKFSYERGAGLTAGPYELGAICAMLTCFWLARRSYALALVCVVGVLVSQSRVSLVAVVVGVLLLMILDRKGEFRLPRRPPRPVAVVAATLLAVTAIVLIPVALPTVVAPSVSRVDDSQLLSAWNEAARASGAIGSLATASQYSVVAYDAIGVNVTSQTASSDASNVVRFYRWQLLLKEFLQSPGTVAFGLGPSFAGPSVDGALLRVLLETGAVGFVAWVVWFRRTLRGAMPWFVAATATLIVGSLFIDLLFALRPMVLFWMLAAMSRKEDGRIRDA